MKRCIYAGCYSPNGSYYDMISDITFESMKKYAKKIGVDFYCDKEYLTYDIKGSEDVDAIKKMLNMKMKSFDLLDNYDQVLYMDSDIYIKDDAENIFDQYNDPNYCYFNNTFSGAGGHRPLMIKALNAHNNTLISKNIKPLLNQSSLSKNYYCAGLFIVSKKFKNIFKNEPPTYVTNVFWEQEWFNLLIIRNKVPIINIDKSFNFPYEGPSFFKTGAKKNFVHFWAGSAQSKYEHMLKCLLNKSI